MLQWLSNKVAAREQQTSPTARPITGSSEERDWHSPNQTLHAIEVKELSIAEFMAAYKATGNN